MSRFYRNRVPTVANGVPLYAHLTFRLTQQWKIRRIVDRPLDDGTWNSIMCSLTLLPRAVSSWNKIDSSDRLWSWDYSRFHWFVCNDVIDFYPGKLEDDLSSMTIAIYAGCDHQIYAILETLPSLKLAIEFARQFNQKIAADVLLLDQLRSNADRLTHDQLLLLSALKSP